MDVRHLTFLAGQPAAAVKNRERFLGMPKRGLAFLLANVMFWQPTWAQAGGIVVSAPGTSVGQSGNGVPIVNIATPNASGLSHNKFHDYNVGANGLILNNASTQTQSTQLGGIIVGNPNLKHSGAAQTILNEVNGGSPSQLRGYTEVAGKSARVIVANPYGISCNGCGFINTPRVTLTTGKPVLDGGRLDHFQVDQGSVTVDGPMLNATNVDRFEIITRSAKINAEIQAKDLSIIAGRNDVDDQTLKATARANDGSAKPQLAIDSSALGGMYAGAIKLVGTEAGVGVKLDGKLIASGGDIQLDANGHLRMADTSASAAVKVNAASLEVKGRVYGTALDVTAHGDVTNHNTLAARDSITLSSGGQLTNNGVIEAGVNADTSRNASGDVSLDTQNLSNRNSVLASRNLTVNTAQTLDNQGGTLSAQEHLNLTAATLNNQNKGRVLSAAGLAINANQLLNNQGQITSNGALNATLGHLNNNSGELNSLTTATLRVASLDNVAGLINAGELLDITASGLLNNQSGQLTAPRIRLNAAHLDNRQRGSIKSQGALDVTVSGHLNNQQKGRLEAKGASQITAGSLDNSDATLGSDTDLTLKVSGALTNVDGNISSAGTTRLTGSTLNNRDGQVSGDNALNINLSGALDNRNGLLGSGKQVDITAASLDNRDGASLVSDNRLTTHISGLLDNRNKGEVIAKGVVDLHAGSVDNRGGQLTGKDLLTLTSDSVDNRGGEIRADKDLHLAVGHLNNADKGLVSGKARVDFIGKRLDNQQGQFTGAGLMTLNAAEVNNGQGRISSLSDLNAEITALKQQGGSLFASGNLTLTGASLDNGKGGLVGATKALKLTVGDIDNRGGEISSSLGLNVKGQRLDNSDGGKVLGTTDLELKVAQVINQSKGLIHANGIASLKGTRLDNLGGKFDSLSALDITLDDALDNGQGLISSEGLLTVNASSLNNNAGRLSSAGALSLTSRGVVLNQSGSISTNGVLTLNSASLDNRQKGLISGKTANQVTTGHFDNSHEGRLTSTGTLNLIAGQVDNATGRIASDLALTASVTGLDQQGGELFSKSGLSLDLNHGQLNTQGGLINASGNLLLKNLNGVNNQKGEISSQQAFTLAAQQLDNSGGTLLSDHALTLRINQKLDNLKGVISAAALDSRSQTLDNTDGLISSHGRLELVVDNALTNQRGSLIGDGALLLNTGTLDNSSGDISSQADIIATLKHLDNQHGKLISTGAFNLTAASVDNRQGGLLGATQALTLNVDALDNRGGELSSHADLNVIGKTFDNRAGHLSSLKNTRVQLSGELDNREGRLSSEGTLKVDAAQLFNAKGSLSSAGDLTLNSVGRVDNQGGELVTNGMLKLDSASLDNRQQGSISGKGPVIVTTGAFDNSQKGQLNSSNTLDLNAAQVTNQDGGRIGSDGTLTAKVSGLDQQGGKLFSLSTLSLDLNHGQLNNQNGLINAPGSLLLTNLNGVNNDGGEISSAEAFTLAAKNFDNSNGKLLNNQGLTLRIAELLTNTKGLIGAAKLDIHAANLNNDGGTLTSRSDLDVGVVQELNNLNQGQISAAQDLTLNALRLNNHNSRVLAGNNLTLNASHVDNSTQGLINSLGTLNITANGLDSSDRGEVSAKGDIRLDLKSLVQNGGRVLGEKAVTLDLADNDFDNRNGLLNAKGPLTLKRLHDLRNQGGEISSQQSFTVAGQMLDNTGGSLISNEQLTLNGTQLINRGGLMSGLKGLTVTGASLDNSYSGSLSSRNGNLGVDLSGNLLNNDGGGLAAQGNLNVSGALLDNSNKGVLSSGGGQKFDLSTGINNSQEGLISSGAGLVINTHTLTNANATINAQQAITLNAGDLDNSLGKLLGNGAMTLALHGALDNNEGKVASEGPLLISGATEVKNRIGELGSKKALTLRTLSLDNSGGTLAANDALILKASGTVQNSAKGLIHSQNADVSIEAASLLNNGGAIQSQSGLTLDISGDFNNQLGKVIAQAGDVSVKAANIDNRGGVLTSLKGALEARTVGVLRNGYETNTRQGGLIQAQRLSLQALTRLDNAGGRLSAQAGDSVISSADVDNRNGSLYATGLTKVTAGTFDNRDGQVGGNRIELGLSGALNNRNGLIESDGTLAVNAASVDNQDGTLRSLGATGKTEFQIGGVFDNRNGSLETGNSDLTLAVGGFINAGGQLLHLGEGNFGLSLANVTGAGGSIVTRGGLTLNADSWTNTSVIQAGRLYVNVDNFVQTSTGQLLASTLFEGRGVNWTNDGLLASDGDLRINLSGAYSGNGRVNSVDKLTFSAASLNLTKDAAIAGGGPSSLNINGPIINYGRITSDDNLQITSASLSNFGTVGSGEKLTLNTPELLNQNGLIFSGADMQLSTNRMTNRFGDIYSFGGLTVAQNAAGARADVVENISGTIESAGDMRLLATSITNRKDVLTLKDEPVDSYIDHQCTHCEDEWNVWYYIHEIHRQAVDTDSPIAFLTAGGNLEVKGSSFLNRYGSVSAVKNINVAVDSFSNEGANLLMTEYVNHYKNPDNREPGRIYLNLTAPGGAVYEYNKYNSKYLTQERMANGEPFHNNPGLRTGELNPNYNPAQILPAPRAVTKYGLFKPYKYTGTTGSNIAAVMQAGGNISIAATTVLNTGLKTEKVKIVSRNRQVDATGVTRAITPVAFVINSQLPPDRAHQRVDPLTLPGFVIPQGQNGLFRLSEKTANTGSATATTTVPQNWTLGSATLGPIQRQQDLPATLVRPIEIDKVATVAASDRQLTPTIRTAAGIDAAPSVLTPVAPDLPSTGPVLPTHPRAADTTGQPTVGVTLPPHDQSIARVTGLPDTHVPVKSHNYLIETNPVITDLKQFMGSDYLLSNLGYDPDKAVKRLGDGFFEQRLVQQAVVARTGQRFLDGMTNNEDMLRHLMDNAIASKNELNLSVGVNLTSQQVAALTHDIVWLEEAVVSGEKVLVPVFYMAQANNRLGPIGALILGQDVSIIAGKDLNNSGTLRATRNLTVNAVNDVVNTGLMEAGNRLDVLAGNDIVNRNGGIINAADVNLSAVMGDVVNQRNVTHVDGKNGKWTWTDSFVDNAARIESANNLNIQAGRDVNSLGGVMSSRADLTINAGRDVNIGAVESLNSITDGRDHRSSSIEQLSSQLTAGRDLRIDTARNLLVAASDLSAGLGMDLSAGANVLITAAANENHFYEKGHVAKRQTDHVEQQASVLRAGNGLNIAAGENLTLVASKLDAGQDAYLVAGEQLELLAAQDNDYSLYDMKKKGGWGAKKTQRDEVTQVTNVGTEIKTGGDLLLASGGDQKYQVAKLESGKDLTLDSGGAITFEGVKDLHDESHTKSDNDAFWNSSKGKGKTDETLRQSQLVAKGNLVIKAVDGLNIDIKHINKKTVSETIDAMVQADPQLAWLKEAEKRGDVDWRQVKEIHKSFKYQNSGLGPAAQLIIAILMAAFVGPAALAAASGGGTLVAGAASAIATSAATNAAVSFVNNRGNLGAVMKDVTSKESIKGYVVAAATAGVAHQLNYNPGKLGFDAKSIGTVAVKVTADAAIKTAVYGGSFTSHLASAAVGEAVAVGGAVGAGAIGDLTIPEGSWQKIALHAGLGGLLAEAMGGDFRSGALAGGANEVLVGLLGDKLLPPNLVPGSAEYNQAQANLLALSQVVGVLGAAVSGGDVGVGAAVAANATQYNYLTHQAFDEVDNCLSGKTCSTQEQKDAAIAKAEETSEWLDSQMHSICDKAPQSDGCRVAVNTAIKYVAMQDAWNVMHKDLARSSQNTFNYLYNTDGASERLVTYMNTIDNRANFFGASNMYEQKMGIGSRWFGGAEMVSRAFGTGLGADGNASYVSFGLGWFLAPVYDWRKAAGDALITGGFNNFKNLYNKTVTDPVAWDIKQLKDEQAILQPIHQQYLEGRRGFLSISKVMTNVSAWPNSMFERKQGVVGGVNVLDYKSRVEFGCKLLGYSKGQGCTP
ncbi:filamentous hemagglutinin N-terminal domain-containing protein [Pseudomonas purpurea]|uniref:two-partner secretion domain-containing protein n=1 Tax=Pseudomonas purpurea TaxID=3136737 RepID=UPI0032672FD6